ncbi:MAG: hypothetical protein ACKVS6_15850, partial [Planctomycetota bacterium]
GATVRGRVLDANDRPTGHEWSVGANLRNLSPRIHAENCYVWPVIPSAKCNKETGEFIIKNVPLGTTHLSASVAEKYADYEIRRTAAGDKIDINPDETDEIIITYFPPAGWQENAVMFKFRWKREPAFSPADEFVKLIRRNGEVFASTPLTEHDPNDRAERYYFLDLPKEEYTIEINDPRFEKKVVRGVKPGLVNETNPPLVGLKGSCSIKVEALDAVQKYPLRNFWVDIQSVAKEIPAQRGTGTFPRQRICVHYGFDPIPENGIFDNIIPGDWEVLLNAEGYTADPVIIKNLQPGKIPTVKFLAHRTQAESKPSDK